LGIPNELSEFLSSSESFIDKNGELPAIRRKEMHLLVEKLSTQEHDDAGYYRRAKLAIACAYLSLNYLKAHKTAFDLAENILEKSILTLQSQFDIKELESLNGYLYTASTNLTDQDEPDFKAVYAGFACFSAANVVLYDTNFDILGSNEKESDPSDWEASYYASLAHCGGAIWEGVGDIDKRKEFWIWYLQVAMPFAWDMKKPLGPVV
jgi:hypothetical protein